MAWEVAIGASYVAIAGLWVIICGIILCIKGRSPADGVSNDVQTGENVPTRGAIVFLYAAIWPALAFVFLGACFLFQTNYGFFQKARCTDSTCDPTDIISTPWVQWLFTAIGSIPLVYAYAAFFSRFASGAARDEFGPSVGNGAGTLMFRLLSVAAGSGGLIFYIFVSIGVEMVTRWTWYGIGTLLILVGVFFPLVATWDIPWTSAEHLVFWPYLIFTLARVTAIIISTDILGTISTEYSQIAYIIINLVMAIFWGIIVWQVASTNGMAVSLSKKAGLNGKKEYEMLAKPAPRGGAPKHKASSAKKAHHNSMDNVIDDDN